MQPESTRELPPLGRTSERQEEKEDKQMHFPSFLSPSQAAHMPISHANIPAKHPAAVSPPALGEVMASTITHHFTLLYILALLRFVLILTTLGLYLPKKISGISIFAPGCVS